jgi:phage tail protein X
MAFTELRNGKIVCSLCHREYGHTSTCPIVELDGQVRDLVAHIGAFVANIQETLAAIAVLLRDDREP